MNRREAIYSVSLMIGGTITGAEFFLSGCMSNSEEIAELFTEDNIFFLNEVAETILPETLTPGAKAADVGRFMTLMIKDCYTLEEQKIFIRGILQLDDLSRRIFGKKFTETSTEQKGELLTGLDKEQKDYSKNKKAEDPNHYFKMMKELTLLGYFTSEIGCTKALRYVPVPGKFDGCIEYKKGDRGWALS